MELGNGLASTERRHGRVSGVGSCLLNAVLDGGAMGRRGAAALTKDMEGAHF